MGRTPVPPIVGLERGHQRLRHPGAALPKIDCPTLAITTDGSGLASVEETRAWQQALAGTELLVIPGNSFHVAAGDAERCARATLDFIGRRGSGA